MWIYRRILKIPWTAKVTNYMTLQRLSKQTEMLETIKRRKLEYLGHVMRNKKLFQIIISGKIEGKRGPESTQNIMFQKPAAIVWAEYNVFIQKSG